MNVHVDPDLNLGHALASWWPEDYSGCDLEYSRARFRALISSLERQEQRELRRWFGFGARSRVLACIQLQLRLANEAVEAISGIARLIQDEKVEP